MWQVIKYLQTVYFEKIWAFNTVCIKVQMVKKENKNQTAEKKSNRSCSFELFFYCGEMSQSNIMFGVLLG